MAAPADQNPLEATVQAAFPWLLAGLLASIPLLLIPASSDRRGDLVIHLSVLVMFLFVLALWIAPADATGWFGRANWTRSRRLFVTAAANIIIVTGVTALVTLASSAALRFQPSLQFLQLLSTLDIAWVVSGTMLAVRWLWGRAASVVAGAMMGVICVLSIALYVAEVGLGADDGWLVDGEKMLQLVIPFDVAAAVITVGLLLIATRQRQPIEQANAHSYGWNPTFAPTARDCISGCSQVVRAPAIARLPAGIQVGIRCGRTKSAPYQRNTRDSSNRLVDAS